MDTFDKKREILHGLTDALKHHAANEMMTHFHPVHEEAAIIEAKPKEMHEGGIVEHAEGSPAEEAAETPAMEHEEQHCADIEHEGEHPMFDQFMQGKKKTKTAKVFNKYSDIKE